MASPMTLPLQSYVGVSELHESCGETLHPLPFATVDGFGHPGGCASGHSGGVGWSHAQTAVPALFAWHWHSVEETRPSQYTFVNGTMQVPCVVTSHESPCWTESGAGHTGAGQPVPLRAGHVQVPLVQVHWTGSDDPQMS
jgi:hypothetical protein